MNSEAASSQPCTDHVEEKHIPQGFFQPGKPGCSPETRMTASSHGSLCRN